MTGKAHEPELSGTINGKHIELDQEVDLPDGVRVVVRIEILDLSLDERRKAVLDTAGAWAEDESLDEIFGEIARQRTQDLGRPVPIDDLT